MSPSPSGFCDGSPTNASSAMTLIASISSRRQCNVVGENSTSPDHACLPLRSSRVAVFDTRLHPASQLPVIQRPRPRPLSCPSPTQGQKEQKAHSRTTPSHQRVFPSSTTLEHIKIDPPVSIALFAGLHGRLCRGEDADCSVVEGGCGR